MVERYTADFCYTNAQTIVENLRRVKVDFTKECTCGESADSSEGECREKESVCRAGKGRKGVNKTKNRERKGEQVRKGDKSSSG